MKLEKTENYLLELMCWEFSVLAWSFSGEHEFPFKLLTLCLGIAVLKLYLLVGIEF